MRRKGWSGYRQCLLVLIASSVAVAWVGLARAEALSLATADERFSLAAEGRIQADYDHFSDLYTQHGDRTDTAYFRRLYLTLSGNAFDDWSYQATYRFTEGTFKTATLGYQGFSPLTVELGIFDPDFGLDKATSSKWITPIERTIAYDLAGWVNSSSEDPGFRLSGTVGSTFYGSTSVLARGGFEGSHDERDRQYNARTVFAPWHEAGHVLHFGLDYAYRDRSDTSFDSRIQTPMRVHGITKTPNSGFRPVLAGSSDTPAGSYGRDSVWGVEFAWAHGPFSFQSEYTYRRLYAENSNFIDMTARGYYGQLAYTLTGEPRAYSLDGAAFGAVTPQAPRLGAWEVFYRYGHLEADTAVALTETASDETAGSSRNGHAREIQVHTLGLNWYASQNIKVMLNLLRTHATRVTNDAGDSSGNAVSARLQYAF